MWDEKALAGIEAAKDAFELAKAKEAAHHYRWRASKIAPSEFGDRQAIEHTGKGGGPMQLEDVTVYTPADRKAKALELAAAMGIKIVWPD